jgi:hypothetical protein
MKINLQTLALWESAGCNQLAIPRTRAVFWPDALPRALPQMMKSLGGRGRGGGRFSGQTPCRYERRHDERKRTSNIQR